MPRRLTCDCGHEWVSATDSPTGRTCPQCGAALAAGEGEMIKCTYCGITARVPGKLARRQIQGEPPKVDPFWVLLDGLSPGRKKLVPAYEASLP